MEGMVIGVKPLVQEIRLAMGKPMLRPIVMVPRNMHPQQRMALLQKLYGSQ